MTAPVLDLPTGLRAAAAWDVALLRGAVGALADVSERLPIWRARLEGVARSLGAGEDWAGPAARSASGALRDLSAGTWAVEGALADSLGAFHRLTAEADAARGLAREALRRSDDVPGGVAGALPDREGLATVLDALVPGAELDPAPALAAAEAALDHAAAAAAAAEEAGEALAGLGVRDAFAPADFSALAAEVPVAEPVCVPPGPTGPPEAVTAWWAALPLTAQLAALRTNPAGLGGRDGLPAWARDTANRRLLATALEDPATDPYAAFTARVVARRIEAEEAVGRQVQLQLLDLAGDRVVLGLGDLDTADAVALLVPGIHNSPGDDLSGLVGDARAVAGASREATPGRSVATAVWLGYDSPSGAAQILGRANAVEGGAALASALAGLRAGREAVVSPDARTVVLAHSYGTVVVDEAADAPGVLAADAVVLMGSPGMEDDAASLEAPEVYDAASPDDLVVALRWFGRATGSGHFDSTGLPVDPEAGHSDYYDAERPTLAAVGEVVTGVRAPD
jgi:hypothetical protein